MRAIPALLGIPFDGASSFMRGAALAPPLIRAAFHSPAGNTWTERGVDLAKGACEDVGDIPLGATPRTAIEASVRAVLTSGRRPVVLGGDHSITYPVVRALRRAHPALSILHLDAHHDLYEEYEGDRYSHACPFARILEEGLCDQLVQVGIRSATGHQREQAARYGVEVIDMVRWQAGDRPALRHPVYVSCDLDVIEPGLAPGVSHREPGGLTVRDVLTVLHAIDLPIVGADVVEYNPLRDVGDLTARVAAKILREILGRMQ